MTSIKRTYGRQSKAPPEDTASTQSVPPVDTVLLGTPKSKIAALLATLDASDEDSGNDGGESPATRDLLPLTLLHSNSLDTANAHTGSSVQAELEAEQDSGSDADSITAYARLKQQIIRSKETTVPKTPQNVRLLALAEQRRAVPNLSLTSPEISTKVRRGLSPASDTDSEDVEAEMRLSTRKRKLPRHASKKALEAMHKETERLQRNMALAPEAEVAVKLDVQDFLQSIGYSSVTNRPSPKQPSVEPINIPINPLPVAAAFAPGLEESDEDIDLPGMHINSSPSAILEAQQLSTTATRNVTQVITLSDDSDEDCEVELNGRLKAHKALFRRRDHNKLRDDRKAAKFAAMARPESPTKLEARAQRARNKRLLVDEARKAKQEREQRRAALEAAGVLVQNATERQKEALELEDIVEKARRQADELRQLEKREDKRKQATEEGGVGLSSEDDRDWSDAGESLSSSQSVFKSVSLTDIQDHSDVEQESEMSDDQSTDCTSESGEESLPLESSHKIFDVQQDDEDELIISRKLFSRRSRIVADGNSDDDNELEGNTLPISFVPPPSPGLTQFFEPTQLADDVNATASSLGEQLPRDSMNSMQALRDVQIPQSMAEHLQQQLEDDEIIPSSQVQQEEPQLDMATQFSLFGPLSQDTPLRHANLSTEFTQATEIDAEDIAVPSFINEIPSRKRLHRVTTSPKRSNPYRKQRSKMNAEEHERSKNALLDTRAIESDDEYAGLGGASDEEPEDAMIIARELEGMIDHEMRPETEEEQRQIAAYHAKKDLENDERMVNALMHDINNGGLRRKRGAALVDIDDSEDEEEERARHKARQAMLRARLLESQDLTSLAENPKTKAFIDALEDRTGSSSFIEIAGEDDVIQETQGVSDVPALAPAESIETRPDAPTTMQAPKPRVKKTPLDIRRELSFLDDEENSQPQEDFDPTFVPSLKRERSSLSIDDRSHASLSRENSSTWRDPRTSSQPEVSLYAQLGRSRKSDTRDASAPVTVIPKSTHLASRHASKAVNYHAKARFTKPAPVKSSIAIDRTRLALFM